MYIFGPVPSRRLGKSLGVNVIPPKICSYSCVYCQLGRTRKLQIEPVEINDIEAINKELAEKLKLLKSKGEQVDYLTFVADGEPTLAAGLGDLIDLIKVYGIKIAVITNSSLVWKEEVKSGLLKADWVSLKCDAVTEEIWQNIDRPYPRLSLDRIKEGMIEFSQKFEGVLATETMLIKDINDKRDEIEQIALFIKELFPDFAYLSIPTRPPAEGYATAA
jgi:wyosine [tRNA(Phe)-imidazoG37] synthetase (radical SAM superfamily)